ncbi:unnamed protein product, partial [marine sediment metagenome]
MSNLFFSADLHLGHAKIIDHCRRPFDSVGQMNECLVERWNETVAPGDTVYLLGDVAYKADDADSLLDRMHGNIRLVRGDHDKNPHTTKGRAINLARFEQMIPFGTEIEMAGQLVVLCHFPMDSWEGKYEGSFMLHGHSHGKSKHVTRRL